MPNEGCTPSPITYKVLLQAVAAANLLHHVPRLHADMKRVGVVPDVPVMKILLESYGILRDAPAMYARPELHRDPCRQ
jgi:pentatricopeptide repeat protein